MPCPITLNGMTRDCKGVGGVKALYIIDAADVSTLTVDASTETITAMTLVPGKKFKTYELGLQTSVMNVTPTVDETAGTLFYQSTIQASFPKMNAARRLELHALALGRLAVIVKDNNDVFWYMGYHNPVLFTEGAATTGTAFGDANQHSFTLTDWGTKAPYNVASSVITSSII